MKYLVIANWKSNLTQSDALEWLHSFSQLHPKLDTKSLDIAIAPSLTELSLVDSYLANWNLHDSLRISSQDISPFTKGAFTGAVNVQQLEQYNTSYAIIGHSERRSKFYETNADIAEKVKMTTNSTITPVVAVSEIAQVKHLKENNLFQKNMVVAYEPIESIGTGNPADPKDVENMINEIKDIAANNDLQVLYGGSVNAETVRPYMEIESVSGFLVGGASNKAQTFFDLLKSISELS